MWTASYNMNFFPLERDVHVFRAPLSCPPTVLKRILQEEDTFGVKQSFESQYLSPSDGVPVKVFAHKRLQRTGKHNCDSCGEEIVKFLKESLRIASVGTFHRFFISFFLVSYLKSSF